MARRLVEFTVIAALGVLLLGLAELSVRAWDRLRTGQWPKSQAEALYEELDRSFGLYRRHAYLNMAPNEGHSVAAFGKRASFNSLGYRSPERPLAKPPGSVRVLVAGGSTSFDLLAADDRSSWPWRLEAALAEGGCAIEMWNAGFPGWTSAENAISLLLRDLDLEPDLVVLFQGINDLQPASLEPFDRHYEGHAAEARRAMGVDLSPLPWLGRSLLLERLSGRDELDLWRRIGGGESGERLARLPEPSIAIFERNVRAFTDLARGSGARVLLMTQTLRLRAGNEEADRRYLAGWLPGLEPEAAPAQLERLNDVLRRLAAAQPDIGLLEAAGEIAWQDADFDDAMHFSAAGSARLANSLATALLADGVCRRSAEARGAQLDVDSAEHRHAAADGERHAAIPVEQHFEITLEPE